MFMYMQRCTVLLPQPWFTIPMSDDNVKFLRFARGVFCRILQPSCKAMFVAQLVASSINSVT